MTWRTIPNDNKLSAKSILKRGFKSNAEKLAKQFRENLDIHPCAPLCAFKLAEYLDIPVYPATDFLSLTEDINQLSGSDGTDCEWSALTMTTKVGNKIIIHNPFHSKVRQQSNIMHELAHHICKHVRYQEVYDFEIPFGMRHFDELQEEEAKCLGSTLLLPTPCLLWARKNRMTKEAIGNYFSASKDMVIYRMNMTGIYKQTPFF